MAERFLFKVLVGSRAHGLSTEESDYDYRGVHLVQTSEFLVLGPAVELSHPLEGAREADTSYELGHFLGMAAKCNPSALEVFRAPVVEDTELGRSLRALFPYLWGSEGVVKAYGGYARQQRYLLRDSGEEMRRRKAATAHVRVLLQGMELLLTGDLHVKVQGAYACTEAYPCTEFPVDCLVDEPWREYLVGVRNGARTYEEVIECGSRLLEALEELGKAGPFAGKEIDFGPVNEFLLRVRRVYF
jgi:predicted nucleotidyltransferase